MQVWLANEDIGKRNFASPDGVDLQAGTNLFCGKKRFRALRLFAVNHQAFYGGVQRQPLD